MNFLAHLYLSRENKGFMIGNFIADAVKGNAFKDYPEEIKNGIHLHRQIDSFTDAHPVFLKSVERLRPRHRKFSGVVVDIFYDHFLAANWKDYAETPLADFTRRVHSLLLENKKYLPQQSQYFLAYMLRENIPLPYATVKGIGKVLVGMSRRTKFENTMNLASEDLKRDYNLYENDFRKFFPDIISFVEKAKRDL